MRIRSVRRAALAVLTTLVVALVAVGVSGQSPGGNPEARKIKNPVPATAASVNAGRASFDTYCALCHGTDGKGNGPLAQPNAKPQDLTDAAWVYGSTDGEIFDLIVKGLVGPPVKMPAFNATLSERDLWNVVNFLRSLGPKSAAR
jgi:mono/diheme cytochrome c family protein